MGYGEGWGKGDLSKLYLKQAMFLVLIHFQLHIILGPRRTVDEYRQTFLCCLHYLSGPPLLHSFYTHAYSKNSEKPSRFTPVRPCMHAKIVKYMYFCHKI